MAPSDPEVIRSIAVSREDVVAAVETNRTTGREAVLRVTPPFSGRMRARLHVRIDQATDGGAVHVDPERLLTDDAPAYPRPAETEDALRADPEAEYTVERHRERHEQAVETWRREVGDSIRDSITLSFTDCSISVAVYALG